MAKIRIDTERVREVGRRFSADGDRLVEIGQELQSAIACLDTWAWDGESRWRAEPMLERVRPESTQAAQILSDLARKLIRVADTFETEDRLAAHNINDLLWVDFDSKGSWEAFVRTTAYSLAVAGASEALIAGYGVMGWAQEYAELESELLFFGREHNLWPERRGRPRDYHPSVDLEIALWEDEVWKDEVTDHTYLGGVRLGGKAEAEALKGEAGIGLGWDDEGAIVGGYAAGTLFTAGASGVIGSKDLGLGGGVEVTAGKAEAFAGYHDGKLGVKVGGTLVSAEGTVGANVAGWNVGLTGEIGVKFELGLEVGKKTKVHLGPFSVGLNIGEALGS